MRFSGIILVLLTTQLFAQENPFSNNIKYKADSALFQQRNTFYKNAGLSYLNRDLPYNFRFSGGGIILDVQQQKDGLVSANIMLLAEEIVRDGFPPRVFVKNISLDNTTSIRLKTLIDSLSIPDILSKPIPEHIGLDGSYYYFEYLVGNNHWFKSYWSPNANKTIKSLIDLGNFITLSSQIIKQKDIIEKFKADVPYLGYSIGRTLFVIRADSKRTKKL